ncbi:DUF494 domain-containing protein [Advenella sp. WQ 585]|uniref:Protein Smg homolog n=1 Tax=Advenella mandrilli TaxID=2800330 RepID=A0ABS1EB09_9BURK|nr:DUF494 domain-containing protein [Advenella mandrilli]MBK1779993.1 DUF494 domain-containing protein [Advenella mandrilli]
MFDVLVYLFENYYTPDACPSTDVLTKRLVAAGFEHEDISDAIGWLYGLAETTEQSGELSDMSNTSTRVYAKHEQLHLGTEAIGFLYFLESSGAITPALREIVIDRAMATPDAPVSLEHFKIITLMVLWSQEAEVDHLVLEELLAEDGAKLLH